MIIKAENIEAENCTCYISGDNYVNVYSYSYHFTVYGKGDKMIGSLTRPRTDRKDGHNGCWSWYNAQTGATGLTSVGPRTAFKHLLNSL